LPQPTPDNSITVSVTVIGSRYRPSPHLAVTSNPVYFLPAEQRIEPEEFHNVCINSSYIRLSLVPLWSHVGPTLFFEALRTKHQSSRMRRIFLQLMCVFRTPYSVVLTINLSVQVDPCFSRDKQIAQRMKTFTPKISQLKTVGSCRLSRLWSCLCCFGLQRAKFYLFHCFLSTCLKPVSLQKSAERLMGLMFL
jgi:hypothetical protein